MPLILLKNDSKEYFKIPQRKQWISVIKMFIIGYWLPSVHYCICWNGIIKYKEILKMEYCIANKMYI